AMTALHHRRRGGGADGDRHAAAGAELLQQRRRNVVDTAGDDDLVERRRLLPTIIAVGALRADRLEFGVATGDQPVIDAARALGERADDLDRPDLVGEVGEICRLVAGAGADLEHLFAKLDVDRGSHAAYEMRARNRDAEADVEEPMLIRTPEIWLQYEFLARCHQEGAHVALV